jgi:hypothetical protein
MPPVTASLGAAGRVQLGLLGAGVSEAKPVNCRDLASPELACSSAKIAVGIC